MTETAARMIATFSPAQLTPASLGAALRTLPPRPAALLRKRLTQGASQEAVATFYGVPPEALAIHVLREAQVLTSAVGGAARPPAGADEEAAWARQLSAALERESAPVSPGLVDTVALCKRLQQVGKEVEDHLAELERLEESSPKRRREELLRRLAVGLLLALAAYFYWTRPPDPAPPRTLPSSR